MSQPASAESERLMSALREILVDVRAQVYATRPELAQLIRAAEHLADAIEQPEERREMVELLRDYERKHLHGRPRYSSLLGGVDSRDQLRWDW